MKSPFENPTFEKPEDQKGELIENQDPEVSEQELDPEMKGAEDDMRKEAGMLSAIARSPKAKKLIMAMTLFTGISAGAAAFANKSEAGGRSQWERSLQRSVETVINGTVRQILGNWNENARQSRRAQDEDRRSFLREQQQKRYEISRIRARYSRDIREATKKGDLATAENLEKQRDKEIASVEATYR